MRVRPCGWPQGNRASDFRTIMRFDYSSTQALMCIKRAPCHAQPISKGPAPREYGSCLRPKRTNFGFKNTRRSLHPSCGPTRIRTWNQGIHVARRFRSGVDYLFTLSHVAGRVREALACDQGRCSPQVVSAPSGGVPPARLRIAAGRTAAVSLNSSRCHPAISRRRHLFDESPALTVEL